MKAEKILQQLKSHLESDVDMFEQDYIEFEDRDDKDLMIKANLYKTQAERYLLLIKLYETGTNDKWN